ncbi:MAG: hypothetical protein HQ522_18150 [Bacteroidetes bacterium]|nr:hypothetical protein [Bacteroidota bacterium]
MEIIKTKIDKYLEERSQYFKTKKSKAKSIHELRLYSNEFTEFVTSLQENILKIIKDSGITDEAQTTIIIESFKSKATTIVNDLSITNS